MYIYMYIYMCVCVFHDMTLMEWWIIAAPERKKEAKRSFDNILGIFGEDGGVDGAGSPVRKRKKSDLRGGYVW